MALFSAVLIAGAIGWAAGLAALGLAAFGLPCPSDPEGCELTPTISFYIVLFYSPFATLVLGTSAAVGKRPLPVAVGTILLLILLFLIPFAFAIDQGFRLSLSEIWEAVVVLCPPTLAIIAQWLVLRRHFRHVAMTPDTSSTLREGTDA